MVRRFFFCFSYLTFPVEDLLDIFTARHFKMMRQTKDDACTDWDQSNILQLVLLGFLTTGFFFL